MLIRQLKRDGQRQLGADWDTTTAVSVGVIAALSLLLFVALLVSRVRHGQRRRRGRVRKGSRSLGRRAS